MKPFIGVSTGNIFRSAGVKQQFLLFDKLAVMDLGYGAKSKIIDPQNDKFDHLLHDLNWLHENGLVIEAPYPETAGTWKNEFELTKKAFQLSEDVQELVLELEKMRSQMSLPEILKDPSRSTLENYEIRISAAMMRALTVDNAVPIGSRAPYYFDESKKKEHVLSIVVKNFPSLSIDTPWEQILDFKSDEESRLKLLRLRTWVSDISASGISLIEIEERIEWLLEEYKAHLRFHKMKYNSGTFESIVTTTSDALLNLLTFNWGTVAKTLFSLRKQELTLLEAERNSPGKEVAYIEHVRSSFK